MSLPMELQIFRACGIPIFVHVFLILYFFYDLSNEEAGNRPPPGKLPDYSKVALTALSCTLGFFVLFGTILMHEFGHCAGAKATGGKVQKILLWPLGGLAFCGSGGGPAKDLVVALAGPLTHVPMYFFWMGMRTAALASPVTSHGTFGPMCVQLCEKAMLLQIMLAIFNLCVPAYPLDCSRVIEALCRLCGMASWAAATVIICLSTLCICLLAASMVSLVKIPYLPFGYHPMNLMLICWLAFQTLQLFASVWQQNVEQHPLFKHDNVNSTDSETQALSRRRSA